ncbi:hypothetical protein [Palleronia rufa]|uniref:hypothetical protein n=1 Tax=Palleronia rufa TaxID=1530186 RepID=UPI001268C6FF|nr:hypothetical protein [Palleronia rufa]
MRLIPTRLFKRVILRRFLAGSAVTFHRDTRHVADHATVAFRGWRGPRSCRDGAPPGGRDPATQRVAGTLILDPTHVSRTSHAFVRRRGYPDLVRFALTAGHAERGRSA